MMASGDSAEPDPLTAAAQASERVRGSADAGAGPPDLTFAFVSSHHAWAMRSITEHVHRLLEPERLVGTTCEAVVGSSHELEGVPGVSLLAMWLPDVRVSTFMVDDLIAPAPAPEIPSDDDARIARAIDASPDLRGTILLLDPYSVPISRLLPAMNRAIPANAPLIGGMASAPRTPEGGGNVFALDDRIVDRGGIGVSFSGPIRIDAVVSQGCRPIGPNLVITKARANLILELGSRPALQVVQEILADMSESERAALRRGLLLGRVADEYKQRFGVGDYLIRAMVGADQERSAIAVSEIIKVGQTVRLHVRDAQTATSDLGMLLDGQKLHGPPVGAMVFTCTHRGSRLFGTPSHDVNAIQRAFKPMAGGQELAKGGTAIATARDQIPVAGFFAAGEIGPVGQNAHFHGHTASIALFRNR